LLAQLCTWRREVQLHLSQLSHGGLQLLDDAVSFPQDAALPLLAILLPLLEAPPAAAHLLQLQSLSSHQHLQTLTQTGRRLIRTLGTSERRCVLSELSYSDGLLVVGQNAALPLQVSLILPEQQLEAASLLLLLLHAAELLIHCSLQVGRTINRL